MKQRLPRPVDLPFPFRAPSVPEGVEPPVRRATSGGAYDTEWARRPAARFARLAVVEGLIRPATAALARPTRRGEDRLADLSGPAIFTANHHSHLDTPLLLTSIPEPWRHRLVVGAAADYFFTNQVTSTVSALAIGAIPIERSRVSRRGADLAAELLDDGWSVVIFPEGGRSPDGWGQPFQGGAAFLADKCGVPVVPVHLDGTGRILGKGMTRPRPGRTTVTFGPPLRLDEDESTRAFNRRLEAAVSALADEVATDWWQARRRAHQDSVDQDGVHTMRGPEVGAWRRQWSRPDRARTKRRRRWP